MASIDWRLLLMLVVSIIVLVGCNLVIDSSLRAPATAYPEVTLTIGRLTTPSRSLVDVETQLATLMTLTPLIVTAPADSPTLLPTATPQSLLLPPPTCQETITGGTTCLGRVENPLEQAVERVTVEVQLLDADGRTLLTQQAAVEQAIIPAGSSAPYRAAFDVPWPIFSGVSALLRSADPRDALVGAEYVSVAVQDQHLQAATFGYVYTATLANPLPTSVELLDAVITLFDQDGQVISYRVQPLDGRLLRPGERLPLRVEIVALSRAAILEPVPNYAAYIEARRAG